jgi:hypothetical protein
MKRAFFVSVGVLMPAFAVAHPSVVPHDHPHATSMLPDLGALALAAIVVGVGFIVVRHRRGMK